MFAQLLLWVAVMMPGDHACWIDCPEFVLQEAAAKEESNLRSTYGIKEDSSLLGQYDSGHVVEQDSIGPILSYFFVEKMYSGKKMSLPTPGLWQFSKSLATPISSVVLSRL